MLKSIFRLFSKPETYLVLAVIGVFVVPVVFIISLFIPNLPFINHELKPQIVLDGKTITPEELYTVDGVEVIQNIFVNRDGVWWGGDLPERSLQRLSHGSKTPDVVVRTYPLLPRFIKGIGNDIYFHKCENSGRGFIAAQHWKLGSDGVQEITSQLWGRERPICEGGFLIDKNGKFYSLFLDGIGIADLRTIDQMSKVQIGVFSNTGRTSLVGVNSSGEILFLNNAGTYFDTYIDMYSKLMKVASDGQVLSIFSAENKFHISSAYLSPNDEIFAITLTLGKNQTESLVKFKIESGNLVPEKLVDFKGHSGAWSIAFDDSGNLYMHLVEGIPGILESWDRNHILKYDLSR